MDVFLIRHTSPAIAKGICYGQTDIGLREDFDEEAEAIHALIGQPKGKYAIFSSPLRRCTLLADRLFPTVIWHSEPRLMELDFGAWEMEQWDAIPSGELSKWMEDFVQVACPGGESYRDLYSRCVDFLSDLQSMSLDQVYIISHAGPIRAIHAYLTDTRLEDSFSLKVHYGEVIRMDSLRPAGENCSAQKK
ncbi:alpha-ribazole phosphatase [Echinicola pacifica]|uniref:Alpha-ribazole phosphatase n=1 Tax=Echinicola pacifica TaxID=346377 RepID=A0A918USN4_9BACT|nr:alpha-ribazole phosphatase [Echinicola pacifica]GGZ31213.1 alpha-ribazole phosphatase [Echinicola pacifica]